MLSPSPSPSSTSSDTLFVFYAFAIPDTPPKKPYSWIYNRMPAGWDWIGAGSTSAMGQPPKEYPREEQFMGPKANKQRMRDYLDKVFARLKKKGWIAKYKIRQSYLP